MQQHALDNFKRVGVEVRTGVRVTEVRRCRFGCRCRTGCCRAPPARAHVPHHQTSCLCLHAPMCLPASFPAFLPVQVSKDSITLSTGEVIKYGVCVWSAGNAPRPLVQQLATQIPQQVGQPVCCWQPWWLQAVQQAALARSATGGGSRCKRYSRQAAF